MGGLDPATATVEDMDRLDLWFSPTEDVVDGDEGTHSPACPASTPHLANNASGSHSCLVLVPSPQRRAPQTAATSTARTLILAETAHEAP